MRRLHMIKPGALAAVLWAAAQAFALMGGELGEEDRIVTAAAVCATIWVMMRAHANGPAHSHASDDERYKTMEAITRGVCATAPDKDGTGTRCGAKAAG